MTEHRLRALQALSGALFALFLLIHLFNQALALAGASVYDQVQGKLRAGYQAPLVELGLVLSPLLAHAGLAVTVMLRRRGKALPPPAWPARLHRYSGRVLLFFFIGHVAATRLPALLYDTPLGFAGVAFSFKWAPLWFWPYYSVFALSGWYHLLFGLGRALPLLGVRRGARLLTPRRLGVVFALGAIALLGGIVSFARADASVMQSDYARLWLDR